jgi:hypothetical protein
MANRIRIAKIRLMSRSTKKPGNRVIRLVPGICGSSFLAALCALMFSNGLLFGQAECTGWCSLTGIRVEGQLMEFGTGFRLVKPDGTNYLQNVNEGVRPRINRDGAKLTLTGNFQGMAFTQVVDDTAPGVAALDLQFTPQSDISMAGLYLLLTLPGEYYDGCTVQLIEPKSPGPAEVKLTPALPAGQNQYLRATAGGVRFISPKRTLEVTFSKPTEVIVRDDRQKGDAGVQAYLAIISGDARAGQSAQKTFTFKAGGEIDRTPIHLALDTTRPGREFDGIGGNFRLQNRIDPAVIQYNLDHLRVAWGRFNFPWNQWQTNEDVDPLEAVRNGQVSAGIRQNSDLARMLARKKIPLIMSVWTAPGWAIVGDTGANRGGPGGPGVGVPRGNPINAAKWDAIVKSIGSYLVYLKQKYGVEPELFSFNESDLGINIRQTAAEHVTQIKKLGAYFASQNLTTKMLLGDTSDATPTNFIKASLADPDAMKYVGAISFHSWRGGSDAQLAAWGDAARAANLPVLCAEGGTDAAASSYPGIFQEFAYCFDEINLYVRLCSLAQPKALLEWQLTADYNVLTGGPARGGGADQPWRPTQRFWNLKQLGDTPAGAFWLPITCDRPMLTCAAAGDIANDVYAVHLVNNGASRETTLTGLPPGLKELRVYVTDARRGMQEGDPIQVTEGSASFMLEGGTFTTLMGSL